jgi:diketogulonate reductase-like aldo/keto reductase
MITSDKNGDPEAMAKIVVLCWQEIPSAVEVRDASGAHKMQLSPRFMELIDAIAMRRNLHGSDDYLMHWRKEKQPDRDGAAVDIVRAVAAELEAGYEAIRTAALAGPPA